MQLTLEQIFNTFCRLLEKEVHDKKIWEALTKAPVCFFDADLYTKSCEAVKKADKMDLYMPPQMPFDEVALVDAHGVTFFYDAVDYEKGERVCDVESNVDGMERANVFRDVAAVVFLFGDSDIPGVSMTHWSICAGRMLVTEPYDHKRGLAIHPQNIRVWMGYHLDEPGLGETSLRNMMLAHQQVGNATHVDLTNAVATGLDQLYYIDLPRHHVVVESPRKRKNRKKHVKQPRTQDRDRIRLIDPEHIRTIYKRETQPGNRESTPHARRGHTRYLKSTRYTNKQWTRIRVRPMWIGEPEWEVGAFKYRVIVRGNDSLSVSM